MEIIRRKTYARAGLLGNPSDGYGGRTISVIVRELAATVTLYEWETLEIVSTQNDESVFRSIDDLCRDVRLHGYYGGIRLIKAAIKGFADYCHQRSIRLHNRNFSVRYDSSIPRQVGLAGSSAIIVATLRTLMAFYNVEIDQRVLPSLVLSVEREQLGIPAGLQDRVIQVYEGCVSMDFGPDAMETIDGFVCGRYEPLDPAILPPLYIAYATQFGEPTEVLHSDLRFRFERGDADVVSAMRRFASFAADGRDAILARDTQKLNRLINDNFDLRRSICHLLREHIEMVEVARSCGVSAKFAGSGGAIIGVCPDDATLKKLTDVMRPLGCNVCRISPCDSAK
ncbi:MAG: mevalonate kinase family protein [Thermoguttaceae bacterium]